MDQQTSVKFARIMRQLAREASKSNRRGFVSVVASELTRQYVAFWLALGWTYSNGRKWSWTRTAQIYEAGLAALGTDHRDAAMPFIAAQDRAGLAQLDHLRKALDPTSTIEPCGADVDAPKIACVRESEPSASRERLNGRAASA
jgi:hypothetical protein